ncbi:RES family NAD+ phosphorylase [Fulvivirga sp.]|uniref:RES family NAD+ phosphorylase n=1 Tax=Fulvivirga sp. TaxID=1931237 RepID=UPI0032ED6123
MIVFRITLTKFSDKLYASGRPARWNSAGTFMIYSASSRALACLENLVHRRGEGLDASFRTLVIEIPDKIKIETFEKSKLPKNWTSFKGQLHTKFVGDGWCRSGSSAVMQVPSAIIPEESNYLINPHHPDFSKIKIKAVEEFQFDNRF